MIGNIHAPVTVTLGKEIGLEAGWAPELLKCVWKGIGSTLTAISNPNSSVPSLGHYGSNVIQILSFTVSHGQ